MNWDVMPPTTKDKQILQTMATSTTDTLLVADIEQGVPSAATLRTLTALEPLTRSGPLTMLVTEAEAEQAVERAARLQGVDAVLQLQSNTGHPPTPESITKALHGQMAMAPHTHIAAPNSDLGRQVIPRLAALLNAAAVTEVAEILSPTRFLRSARCGTIQQTVELPDEGPRLLTLRAARFSPAPMRSETGHPVSITQMEPVSEPYEKRLVACKPTPSQRPALLTAPVVVGGGGGFTSAEEFSLMEALADQLGAAVGATRSAVDAGLASNDAQIGKVIAPRLYIAFGLSGAIQHLAGVKDAGAIVAVNSDPGAPILAAADVALVGNQFQVIPELMSLLAER